MIARPTNADNATLVARLMRLYRAEGYELQREAAARIAELEATLISVQRYAIDMVLAEREACAQIATGIGSDRNAGPYYLEGWIECARELAIRIRARPAP